MHIHDLYRLGNSQILMTNKNTKYIEKRENKRKEVKKRKKESGEQFCKIF